MIPGTQTVLVTGGSGFVGSAVLRRLAEEGHRVFATATETAGRDLLALPNLEWITWDAAQRQVPDVPWQEVDVILHLALTRAHFDFPSLASSIFQVSLAATFELLEAARTHGVSRFLLASTGDVLSPAGDLAFESEQLYRPESFYATTKACSEFLVNAYGSTLATAILRIFHPYGPAGDRFLVNRLMRRVQSGETITIEGEHGILINPVWLDDLADGIRLAVESNETGVFHFAGPDMLTLRQMLLTMGDLVGRKPKIVNTEQRPLSGHAGDFGRSRALLGYEPKTSLEDGLRRVLEQEGQTRSLA